MSDQGVMSLPQSVESEKALLGSILIAPEMLEEIRPIVTPEQFYIHRFRWCYQALLKLADEGKAIDFLTVQTELENMGALEEFGGIAELTNLMALAPNAYNAESYALEINETWVRRQMLESANKVAKLAYGQQWPLEEIQAKTVKLIQDCFSGVAKQDDFIYAHDAVSAQFDQMFEAAAGGVKINPTGFIDIDYLLNGGPRPGDLVIVAGRPGMGKTALLLDILKNNAERHQEQKDDSYDVIFSLEMGSEQLIERLVAKGGVSFTNIRSGKLDDLEYTVYISAVEQCEKYKFIIVDIAGLRPDQLRSALTKLSIKHKLDNVYVDYLQLMNALVSRGANRVEEVSEISRQLKIIAREFDVVMYAGAQLSRAVEQRKGNKPVLSDLRESGSIEQDADIVMFIYRPELYENDPAKMNIAEIIIAKHRNGAVGTVTLIFRKNFVRFENAEVRNVNLNGDNGKVEPKEFDLRDITV